MKITKSELKEMIREALREELYEQKYSKLSESQNICYICKKPIVAGDKIEYSLFGVVHGDVRLGCWSKYYLMPERRADDYYNLALGKGRYSDPAAFKNYLDVSACEKAWADLRVAGKLPFSDSDCDDIEQKFKARLSGSSVKNIKTTVSKNRIKNKRKVLDVSATEVDDLARDVYIDDAFDTSYNADGQKVGDNVAKLIVNVIEDEYPGYDIGKVPDRVFDALANMLEAGIL